MPEESFSPGGWPPKPAQAPSTGTREGEFPITNQPLPKVDIRTEASDIKSMQESGGGTPQPYTPSPSPFPSTPPSQEQKSEAPIFQPPEPATPPFVESTPRVPPAPPKEPPFVTPAKRKKSLFLVILVIIVALGLAAISYFFVYPIFFGGKPASLVTVEKPVAGAPEAPPAPVPAPEPGAPEIAPTPETPAPTGAPQEAALPTTPAPPGIPQGIPPQEPAATLPPPSAISHTSLLKSKADLTSEVNLTDVTVAALRNALQFSTAEVPVLKELVLKDASGNLVTFGQIGTLLDQNVFTTALAQSFEQDLTIVSFTDSKGTWLGFVAKVKGDANLDEVKAKISELEKSPNLANFYVSDPGAPGSWKSGQAEGVATRYTAFSQSGAGLNYGWLDNVLIISGSYNGFKEAAKRLK